MSKARVIVLSVVQQGMSKAEAARRFGVSRRWVHTLVTRYQLGGLDALESQSRRPHTSPMTTADSTRSRILELRRQLTADGLDAGPVTIAWHLDRDGVPVPAVSTIRRILLDAGLTIPEPRKRPRSSYVRFAAEQPNETWQSDFTHWPLADGADVEVLNWLDDHSRLLLSCTAHDRVTAPEIVTSFTTVVNEYGPPASTLTDNGSVYTSRFTGGRNAFEYLLATAGIRQKNGHPYHPQTQGKIERLHQTLKLWLGKLRLSARTFRVRIDTVDRHGKLTLMRWRLRTSPVSRWVTGDVVFVDEDDGGGAAAFCPHAIRTLKTLPSTVSLWNRSQALSPSSALLQRPRIRKRESQLVA